MKKLLVISAVALAVMTGCAQQSTSLDVTTMQQAAAAIVVSPNDQRQYKTLTLPNKLAVVLVSDPASEKSAVSLSVGAGMLQDPMSQQGLAHYLEHMLFMGTERYPDPAEYAGFMSLHNGAYNAYTWLDITNYMFEINNNVYDEALDRFSDFFKSPKFYPEYSDKERNAVNAEQSMRREMDFLGQFELMRRMFGDHPSNRFLAGSLESLSDKPDSKLHDEMLQYYQRYYSANNMKLAMISNLPLAEMELLALKHFAAIENKDIAIPSVTTPIDNRLFGAKRIHYVPNQDIKQLRLDFTIRANLEKYAVKPNEYISYLLGSEMPGTAAAQLKAAGLISSMNVSANPDFYGNYGSLTIDLSLTDAGMQQREAITAVVMQYLALIKEQGVDSKYFNEIKTSLSNQFQFLEKTDGFGYASQLTASMLKLPVKDVVAAPYLYERFDAAAIEEVLAQLTPENLRLWYISKQEPHDSELVRHVGKYKIVGISAEEQAAWQQPIVTLNLPQVNRLLPESFAIKTPIEQQKPTLVHEQAGIKAWLYPSKVFADQPKGRLDIVLNSPAAQNNVQAKVAFALWRDLYNLAQSALATEAQAAGISMWLNDGNGLTLNLDGFTDKQPELLEQVLAGLTPAITEEGFDQAVDRYVRGIANQTRQVPFRQAFWAFNSLYRGGNYNPEQLIAAAKQMTLADLQQVISNTLLNNEVRVFAFGNYDKQEVVALVSKLQAALPAARQSTAYTQSPFWQPTPGKSIVLQRDIDVTDVALIDMHVHPTKGMAQRAAASVLASHFSNQAFDKLRTEEQLAYAVGGTAIDLDEYTGFGLYIQTPVKGPAEMQQRFDEFKQQYWLSLQQVTPEQFAQLKQSLLLSLNEPPKNLFEEMQPLVSDWYRERFQFDSKAKLIAAVEQVNLDDVKAFYQQTLLNPDAARISVQMRGTSFKDQPFATLPNQQVVNDLAEFQKTMPKQ
ncbi:insulinase family protein [Rheinheimera sp. UJ51]|uniref:insulinase family protein n=1 Tax=Rheinheimera sp. UJ51 TaxID=2892446 RepID=UPI001E511906|nr:insulinase family protein [Rheinheimera sp. UJ51]MCC5450681.1 insulinase family protein [Rheinheimera sp. UJ51]